MRLIFGGMAVASRCVHEWQLHAVTATTQEVAAGLASQMMVFVPIMQRWAKAAAARATRSVQSWRQNALEGVLGPELLP